MFNKKSVAGLCATFTDDLMTIMDRCTVESETQECIIEAATDKQKEADREFRQANTALNNVRDMFVVE